MIISQGDERHDQEKRMLDHALKVLLVDDNKVNQFLGKRILNNLGVTQVDLAGNGNRMDLVMAGARPLFL